MSVTILIADDEERWRRIVGDFLRNEGYRVLEAADGQQVMELMRSEEKIDLVVLDIMMPVLDGLETCRLIRKMSAVPVMIVTARDAEADELVGFHCGADDFIAKPLRFPVFIARVKALLKRTKHRHGAGRRGHHDQHSGPHRQGRRRRRQPDAPGV